MSNAYILHRNGFNRTIKNIVEGSSYLFSIVTSPLGGAYVQRCSTTTYAWDKQGGVVLSGVAGGAATGGGDVWGDNPVGLGVGDGSLVPSNFYIWILNESLESIDSAKYLQFQPDVSMRYPVSGSVTMTNYPVNNIAVIGNYAYISVGLKDDSVDKVGIIKINLITFNIEIQKSVKVDGEYVTFAPALKRIGNRLFAVSFKNIGGTNNYFIIELNTADLSIINQFVSTSVLDALGIMNIDSLGNIYLNASYIFKFSSSLNILSKHRIDDSTGLVTTCYIVFYGGDAFIGAYKSLTYPEARFCGIKTDSNLSGSYIQGGDFRVYNGLPITLLMYQFEGSINAYYASQQALTYAGSVILDPTILYESESTPPSLNYSRMTGLSITSIAPPVSSGKVVAVENASFFSSVENADGSDLFFASSTDLETTPYTFEPLYDNIYGANVTGLIHRYSPGVYSLEAILGNMTVDIGAPMLRIKPKEFVEDPRIIEEIEKKHTELTTTEGRLITPTGEDVTTYWEDDPMTHPHFP